MIDAIQDLAQEYVEIRESDRYLAVLLRETPDEDGQKCSMIIVDNITFPGLNRELAERYAKRLRDALYQFAAELLDNI